MNKSLTALSILLFGLSACSDANQSAGSAQASSGVSCEYPQDALEPARPVDPPPSDDVPSSGTTDVILHLSAGDITLTLDHEKAPCTVNSFLSLAQQGYYDATDCHHLVDAGLFILQCGDPTATGTGGPGYVFADELTGDERYEMGVVAMANRGPDTNGSQFFLVWDDTELAPDYTVFGTMDEAGLEVVQSIASQGADAVSNAPIAEAHIESVTLG